jgi:hypothetical protein
VLPQRSSTSNRHILGSRKIVRRSSAFEEREDMHSPIALACSSACRFKDDVSRKSRLSTRNRSPMRQCWAAAMGAGIRVSPSERLGAVVAVWKLLSLPLALRPLRFADRRVASHLFRSRGDATLNLAGNQSRTEEVQNPALCQRRFPFLFHRNNNLQNAVRGGTSMGWCPDGRGVFIQQ